MHLHFEKNSNTRCDCPILSLSWMGKVPDDIPEEEGWKLNRTNYYQEGWLATGNVRGIVGVTFTTSHCKKNVEYPLRTNYNLRGHRSDVILVKWNEPYQKLASCDSSGIIFVWIKYEGRWSVELINDRNTPVTHFSWSHDGRMALICYQDGFVLVGSVAGQRYWSSMLNLDATITCGIWTPDDQQVYFGTTQGQIIVMDVHGAMVSQVPLSADVGITAMAWSCEKFKMEEGEDTEPGVTNASKRSFVLAVSFQNGYIYLLKSYDDITPSQIHTGLNGELGIVMEWSNSRELLAVAGTELGSSPVTDVHGATVYNNLLKFYTESGSLLYTAKIPNSTYPVSALTWGHNDKRIFIATGTQVHIAWVSRRVASLQLFCRLKVQSSLASEALLPRLPLPSRIKALIGNLFAQTIRIRFQCCVPDLRSLREFVSRPPACSTRLHCTMIRHDDDSNQSSGTCYTLYLEFLGGLVPLLKGKRTSKIRPEFVIFDPQVDVSTFCTYSSDSTTTTTTTKSSSTSSHSTTGTNGRSDSSESEIEEDCRSPRLDRKRKPATKKRPNSNGNDRSPNQNSDSTDNNEDLAYLDTLPELVEVTSNIWGTKFKIHGLAKTLPANLGQVTYKTSLLHLQPRQMKLVITELRDDFPTGPDPNFNPNIFSEDEEDQQLQQQQLQQQQQQQQQHQQAQQQQLQHLQQQQAHHHSGHHGSVLSGSARDSSPSGAISRKLLNESAPPIAPMSPRPNRFPSRPRRHQPSALAGCSSSSAGGTSSRGLLGPLARAESYEDDTDGGAATESSLVVVSEMHPVASPAARTPPRQSIGYSLVGRPSSASSNQSRVAISPLYCEGSVPTLQSPKNAVAPSDIIFDRPPAGQTTLMSYSGANDYIGSLVQMPKVSELSENETEYSSSDQLGGGPANGHRPTVGGAQLRKGTAPLKFGPGVSGLGGSKTPILNRKEQPKSCAVCKQIAPTVNSTEPVCVKCRKNANQEQQQGEADELARKEPGGPATANDAQVNASAVDPVGAGKPPQAPPKTKRTTLGQYIRSACGNHHGGDHHSNGKDSSNGVSSSGKGGGFFDRKSSNNNQPLATTASGAAHGGESPSTTTTESTVPAPSNSTPSSRSVARIVTSFTDSPLFSRRNRQAKAESTESGKPQSESNNPILLRWSASRSNRHNKADSLDSPKKHRRNGSCPGPSKESTSSAVDSGEPTSSGTATTSSQTDDPRPGRPSAGPCQGGIISRWREMEEGGRQSTPPASPARLARSSPASPTPSKKSKRHQSASPIRHILNSPLLNRRQRKKQHAESSDDENGGGSGNHNNHSSPSNQTDDSSGSTSAKQYRDLETFQKAQLRQKLKRGKIEPNGVASFSQSPAPVRREFVMHNKAPMWNENSQVYQLDFGGRVTQESAKNFQIEFRGKQVMQFGRIDGNAYTLDFQYPFSALQAFAVALANVTQRLK
uniref:SOCS box domain-containing protein n=1 Tax=Anopheles atroparvus TaxID=41427 RepID=A0AAG5CQ29_ANOAO